MLVSRALRLRCPNCGGGPLFSSWFRMRRICPSCGLDTQRGEDGYAVGAYLFNIMAAELLWAGLVGVVVASTWPTPPWTLLLYGGGGLMLTLPMITYPFSKTMFLACDLIFRPAEKGRYSHRTR
jgi:uncharacterized protein (DUF983 family)